MVLIDNTYISLLRLKRGHLLSSQPYLPALNWIQAGNRFQEHRLTRPGRTQDYEILALVNRQLDILKLEIAQFNTKLLHLYHVFCPRYSSNLRTIKEMRHTRISSTATGRA